jgi:hypothetical protein
MDEREMDLVRLWARVFTTVMIICHDMAVVNLVTVATSSGLCTYCRILLVSI